MEIWKSSEHEHVELISLNDFHMWYYKYDTMRHREIQKGKKEIICEYESQSGFLCMFCSALTLQTVRDVYVVK